MILIVFLFLSQLSQKQMFLQAVLMCTHDIYFCGKIRTWYFLSNFSTETYVDYYKRLCFFFVGKIDK